MKNLIDRREGLYLGLRGVAAVFGAVVLAVTVLGLVTSASTGESASVATLFGTAFYVVIIFLYLILAHVLVLGHVKGNGIPVTAEQFPEVWKDLEDVARELKVAVLPEVYLTQNGGLLNAFASRMAGRNYITIYSDVFALANSDPAVLKFILAHELSHVSRKHLQKRFWTVFGGWVPFLGPAYSRACEYTCDRMAQAICPEGATRGLLLLAAGPALYRTVDVELYLRESKERRTFSVRLAGVFASHPHLPARLSNLSNPR